MSNEIIDGKCTRIPDDQQLDAWRERLQAAQRKLAEHTIPEFIEFCEEVHAFRENCGATQGGSEFSKRGCEWLGVSQQRLSEWDAVGRRAPELTGAPVSLPCSEDSVCRIASLDDIAFRKALPKLAPNMPQKAVRELVAELSPRPKPTAQEQETAIERKRERLYKAFKALPDKHQFVLGRAICSDLKIRGWDV